MATLEPLARRIEAELAEKLDGSVKLRFDSCGRDQADRAQAAERLAKIEGVTGERALWSRMIEWLYDALGIGLANTVVRIVAVTAAVNFTLIVAWALWG